MDLELTGQRVLVTAASRGIGFEVARSFLEEGASVSLVALHEDTLEAARSRLGDLADHATTHVCDLRSTHDVERVLDDVLAQSGGIDVAVINTGGPPTKPVLETTLVDWAAAYDLLLRPAAQIALRVGNDMAARGSGSIIFLTSTWVKQARPGGVLSAAFRSGVSALSKHMAVELAPSGVRVNQVMPGITATDRMNALVAAGAQQSGTSEPEELARMVADIPRGRWADVREIADAVVFLASCRSAATTGVALQVDGGAVRSVL